MAAQYLGRPASSAGVERMFSKAGKLHDDLKKRQVDDTLDGKNAFQCFWSDPKTRVFGFCHLDRLGTTPLSTPYLPPPTLGELAC